MNPVRNLVKQHNRLRRDSQWDRIGISNGVNYLNRMDVAGISWIMPIPMLHRGKKDGVLSIRNITDEEVRNAENNT
jgi:hypothetical protein